MNRPTAAVLEATEARIRREFGRPDARAVSMARTMLRLTLADPIVRCRYGDWLRRAKALGLGLDVSIVIINHAWRAELDTHRRSASLWGRSIHPHIDCDIAHEARYLLRWVRRRCPQRWPEIVGTLRKI